MKRWLLLLTMALVVLPSVAQNSKRVRDLKNQKAQLQKTLNKSKLDLEKTKNDVSKGQHNVRVLAGEIEVRVQNIQRTSEQLDSLNEKVDSLKEEIRLLDSALVVKKARYVKGLRMAQAYRRVNSSLLYALAASDITQMYRRLRYTREYAVYQRAKGEEVQAQQVKVLEHQNRLLDLKSQVNQKMQVLISERSKLAQQQALEQSQVNSLQKKQKGLQKQVKDQSNQLAALQKKIDEVVAYEIEQARKRAEAEARRKAEAARKKAQEEARRKADKKSSTAKSTGKTKSTDAAPATTAAKGGWLTAEDKKLNGGFEQNRGRLPVPITGQYRVGSHYGANTSGKKQVTLLSKGVNYVGRAGAKARAVFDGEVSAVFSLSGMKNVLVRHGSYISVYCNLSSVSVRKGQKVKTRDTLGAVASDGDGNYVLHFQLRKETTRLNPEQWVGR